MQYRTCVYSILSKAWTLIDALDRVESGDEYANDPGGSSPKPPSLYQGFIARGLPDLHTIVSTEFLPE